MTELVYYSEEKKAILENAMGIFSQYNYHDIDITNLIALLDIEASHFYRNFDGKKDLYRSMIEQIARKKIKYMDNRNTSNNITGNIQNTFHRALAFLKSSKNYLGIYRNFMKNKDLCMEIFGIPLPSYISMCLVEQNEPNSEVSLLLGENHQSKPTKPLSRDISLNEREVEILKLVDQGLSNADISDTLYLSENTVKWYLYNLNKKLYSKNRIQASKIAKELQMI